MHAHFRSKTWHVHLLLRSWTYDQGLDGQFCLDVDVHDSNVGDPHVGDPHVGDPRVGDPRVGDPRVGDPRVGDPHVGCQCVAWNRHELLRVDARAAGQHIASVVSQRTV